MTFPRFLYVLEDEARPGEIRYVGLCVSEGCRWRQHVRCMKGKEKESHRPLYQWMRQPGVRARMRLYEVVPAEQADESERKAIAGFRAVGMPLLNLNDGGRGVGKGYLRDEAFRAACSRARKGRPNPHKGTPKSEETRAKIRAALSGRALPESTRQKISQTLKGKVRESQ